MAWISEPLRRWPQDERESKECSPQTIAQHDTQNVISLCSQRHPDADLLGTLRDDVRQNTEYARRGKHQ